jgi:hypothetical protein
MHMNSTAKCGRAFQMRNSSMKTGVWESARGEHSVSYAYSLGAHGRNWIGKVKDLDKIKWVFYNWKTLFIIK